VQIGQQAVSRTLPLAILFLIACAGLRAQQLPIRIYTTSDGLPRNGINAIVRDSHGFLWFCTVEGLSRFDGYTFTNYGVKQGVPDSMVTDLIETRTGEYWIATFKGVARFDPHGVRADPVQGKKADKTRPEPRFIPYPAHARPGAERVSALLEDRDGTIWCGTEAGLCRLRKTGGQWRLEAIDVGPAATRANAITRLQQGKDGALWIGTGDGLYRRWPDGRVERYTGRSGLRTGAGEHPIQALLEDRNGGLWVGTSYGLFLLVTEPDPKPSGVARAFTTKQGLPHNRVDALFQSSDGKIWIGTQNGLATLYPESNGRDWKLGTYPAMRVGIGALVEDRGGDLWIGTENRGAMRLARNGFTTYGAEEGMQEAGSGIILEDRAGQLCVISKPHGKLTLHRFDGTRFEPLPFDLPPWITNLGRASDQAGFQDRAREWWLATAASCWYGKVGQIGSFAHLPPRTIYSGKKGIGERPGFLIYQDGRSHVWGPDGNSIACWDCATQTLHSISLAQIHPGGEATAFAEDRLGNLWMGFMGHDLARYRDGHFAVFTPADGLPDGTIYSLHVDHLGRLWIGGTRGGVARVDDPGAERPRFVKFPEVEGLSDNDVQCITEDRWGRIYVGTGHGLYRFDPATGRTKRYTAADGLAGDPVTAFRDRHGVLWFSSSEGLSRLVPEPEGPATSPPPIRITGLRVAGIPYPISELGETYVAGLAFEQTQNDLEVNFASLNFGLGEVLRYQFRLDGEDWSPPADQRSINLAHLASGKYQFQVRAVNGEGRASSEAAVVSFEVLAPFWRRGGFLVTAVLFMALGASAFRRYHLAQLLKLERLRTRIATDLHDDIGTSLSGMAFLSEAVKQQIGSTRPEAFEMASEVAAMARGLARALNDVVWSIDPRREDLGSVITRVRQSAAVLEAQGIGWSLQAPPQPERVKLTPEQRHHLYLIFKEAVTNIARHAHCVSATLTVTVEDRQLRAEIVDDGCGFSLAGEPGSGGQEQHGNGLRNMKLRAARLGGRMNVDSAAGCGVRLELTVPLSRKLPGRQSYPKLPGFQS